MKTIGFVAALFSLMLIAAPAYAAGGDDAVVDQMMAETPGASTGLSCRHFVVEPTEDNDSLVYDEMFWAEIRSTSAWMRAMLHGEKCTWHAYNPDSMETALSAE